ncbi:FMN-binding negative transcriptional regulator [Massilia sp. Leaf139]|uniref:FMN-binding negative transcriptional regulator n=1 Tax=Massilia sp. Leaf139 TaxID=1736272 RepID=UPI00070033C2|nr:FMN-binding negative transcriptional regulator [Massilia sp. Leaf139]KQQ86809.1 transcriptional regulator [Massilia sp. Leaf139]
MYVPAHFNEERVDVLHAFMREHPFATLVTHGAAGLDANHMPFELDAASGARGVLSAHMARANPMWADVSDGDEVLAIFRAGDAYISPSWYPSKHETHKHVPTWNYMVVHAYGRIRVRDDERFVRSVLARLTRTHEAGQPVPWKMGDAPAGFIDGLLEAIVGIEIEITRLYGKFKLSQNREARDVAGAAAMLDAAGEHAIGAAMLARLRPDTAP